jgi:hypothetical protein
VANAAASIAIGIAVFVIAASMAAVQRGWGETPSSTECHTRAIPQRWGVNILTTKRRLDHPYSSAGKMAKWGGVGRGKLFLKKGLMPIVGMDRSVYTLRITRHR